MGVLFLLVFIAGFGIGRITAGSPAITIGGAQSSATPQQTTPDSGTPQAADGTKVQANALTEGQRKMLSAMGIDPNSITITPAMVACAEAKLGAPRIEEIKNGATPSFTEGASLMACYK